MHRKLDLYYDVVFHSPHLSTERDAVLAENGRALFELKDVY